MKTLRLASMLTVCLSLTLLLVAQDGPKSTSSDTVARPRKSSGDSPTPPAPSTPTPASKDKSLPPLPSEFKRPPNAVNLGPTFRTESTEVTVDVSVVDSHGTFIPNIPQQDFRVTEDDVPQKITAVNMGEAPMTISLVIEFSNLFQQYGSEMWYQTRTAAIQFLNTLKPNDYVAIVAYDLRPEILSDFSINRRDAADAIDRLSTPGFSETVLYDALTDVADRMSEVDGRKAIVVIASGIDTISQQNFGQARKRLQAAGVPIYSVGLMESVRQTLLRNGQLGDNAMSAAAMADSQLRTFSKESGGQSFFPAFEGDYPPIFNSIATTLRTQYVLTYTPTNAARDGKFRKLKVILVDPATNKPLVMTDKKGKNIKYDIITKPGYTAPHEVQ